MDRGWGTTFDVISKVLNGARVPWREGRFLMG